MTAYEEGFAAASILSNPYWTEYPRPSKKGIDDEIAACRFVDGWCDKASHTDIQEGHQ